MSVDNGNKYASDGNPTTTNNFDLGKLELTAGYKFIPKLGVELFYTPAVYGQNTAVGSGPHSGRTIFFVGRLYQNR